MAAQAAVAGELRSLRLLGTGESQRLVLDIGSAAESQVFTLANPDRLVIDLKNTSLRPDRRLSARGGAVRDVRHGRFDGGLRVVLDLDAPVTVNSFNLPADGGFGYRLVIDLKRPRADAPPSPGRLAHELTAKRAIPASADKAAAAPAAAPIAASTGNVRPNARSTEAPVVAPIAPTRRKPVVVAVDAGHGGQDPGAIGPDGVEEKDVTLAIARRLAALIDAVPGMKAVLTRSGDYYVGLRERMVEARKAQADLFVSIHCNSYRDHSMHGSAVYVLSNRGATSEQARWLVNQENAADLVGGIDISDKDSQVAAVLLDISQSATMEASFDLAHRLLQAIQSVNALQKPYVQQAAFVVLKAPDIPSILVETDFLTNRRQERRLASDSFQESLSRAMLGGIKSYFSHYRPQPQLQATAKAEPVSYPPPSR
ncbi:MAG: N-acetylmuramoyl-L-alanine amidase [Gammaproteobacteria bacterium]|nr:N-acetylmuramoyl-L-alanine amidase [Gammaproteobacteria bacterium]